MQVGDDPGAVGERVAGSLRSRRRDGEAGVELVELARDGGEALRSRRCARARACSRSRQRVVLGEPRDRGRRELRLLAHARRRRRSRCPRPRLERDARRALERGHEDRGLVQERRARLRRRAQRAHVHAAAQRGAGTSGRPASGFVRRKTSSQPGSSRERPHDRARRAGARRAATRATISRRFSAGPEELEVDPGRDEPVVAGEALGRCLGRLLGGRDERVDARRAAARAAPCRAGSRAAPARRSVATAKRVRVAQREVREARQAGLEAVDDVVAAAREREREVGAHADAGRRFGSAARPAAPARARSPRRRRRRAARAARRSGRSRASRARAP